MADEVRPVSLKREGDGLKIEWSDGVTTTVAWQKLRSNCPCASCQEERKKPADPFRILTAQEVAAGAPAPVAMTSVGPLRVPDSLERRPRHRHLPVDAASRAVAASHVL